MQEIEANETTLPEVLAAVASGGKVRLLNEQKEAIAVVEPTTATPRDDSVNRSPGWLMRLRENFAFEKYGVTKEEADSWRDRSPDRGPKESFSDAMAEYRRTHDIEQNGVTAEEVDSWRDRSPGRESPF